MSTLLGVFFGFIYSQFFGLLFGVERGEMSAIFGYCGPAARAAANEMPPLPDGESQGPLLLVSLAREVEGWTLLLT
jgi:hypothetical protein